MMDPFGFPPTTTTTTGVPSSNAPTDSAILFLDTGSERFAAGSLPPPRSTVVPTTLPDPFETSLPLPPPAPPSSTAQSSATSPDGHQILDQVQQELQFYTTTGGENTFVTGSMMTTNSVVNMANTSSTGSAIVSGSMDAIASSSTSKQTTKTKQDDTDYLISTNSISIGSPVSASFSDQNLVSSAIDIESIASSTTTTNRVKYSIWQFDYYAQYFDLSTDIFLRRVLWSLLPLTGEGKGTYIDRHIASNPDLYGPFWISLTLAFVLAICDNIVTYRTQLGWTPPTICPSTLSPLPSSPSSSNGSALSPGTCIPDSTVHHSTPVLEFTFDRLNVALAITSCYVCLSPLVLWSFCQWRRCVRLYTFLECLCAYGYSLSIFIPVALLSLVAIREMQFILFASGAFLSGLVLLISFAPMIHSDPSRSFKFAYIMIIFILAAHFFLALFYFYFFD